MTLDQSAKIYSFEIGAFWQSVTKRPADSTTSGQTDTTSGQTSTTCG